VLSKKNGYVFENRIFIQKIKYVKKMSLMFIKC